MLIRNQLHKHPEQEHELQTNISLLNTLSSTILEPKIVRIAVKSLEWIEAMREELRLLQKNNTWILVP